MKRFRVTYLDEWEMPDNAKEEDVYDKFLEYLADCVKNGDVTAFDFEEVVEDGNGHEIRMPINK
tara:strand:+ start:45 stop:236 length:192 start_codon:yes stop_codon:yes gene_type:complete